MRATQIPDIHAIYVEKEELLPFAYGAKGIGALNDPHSAGGSGGLLRQGSCVKGFPANGRYLLLKKEEIMSAFSEF